MWYGAQTHAPSPSLDVEHAAGHAAGGGGGGQAGAHTGGDGSHTVTQLCVGAHCGTLLQSIGSGEQTSWQLGACGVHTVGHGGGGGGGGQTHCEDPP